MGLLPTGKMDNCTCGMSGFSCLSSDAQAQMLDPLPPVFGLGPLPRPLRIGARDQESGGSHPRGIKNPGQKLTGVVPAYRKEIEVAEARGVTPDCRLQDRYGNTVSCPDQQHRTDGDHTVSATSSRRSKVRLQAASRTP